MKRFATTTPDPTRDRHSARWSRLAALIRSLPEPNEPAGREPKTITQMQRERRAEAIEDFAFTAAWVVIRLIALAILYALVKAYIPPPTDWGLF